jgi:hypothetical protein
MNMEVIFFKMRNVMCLKDHETTSLMTFKFTFLVFLLKFLRFRWKLRTIYAVEGKVVTFFMSISSGNVRKIFFCVVAVT